MTWCLYLRTTFLKLYNLIPLFYSNDLKILLIRDLIQRGVGLICGQNKRFLLLITVENETKTTKHMTDMTRKQLPVEPEPHVTGTCKDRDENGVQLLYFIII